MSCSGRGANISPLLPVEIQSEKLTGRQLSQESSGAPAAPPDSSNIHDFVIDNKLTLALDCNAGSDGVVTVSLSSPTTFATHIPQAAGFPDGQLSPAASDSSETTAGPTVTQLQGRPPLPSADGGLLTISNDHLPGQDGQNGSSTAHGTDSNCETTSSPYSVESSASSTICGCAGGTEPISSQSISACKATAQQASTHTTAASTSTQSSTVSSCDKSSEADASVSSKSSSSSTSSTSTTSSTRSTSSTSSNSSISSPSRVSSTPTASSTSEKSSCEASESITQQASKATTTSTACSGGGSSYGGDVHLPKLPAQKTFYNTTATETPSLVSSTNTGSSSSCDTTSTVSTTSSSVSSAASPVVSSVTSSTTSTVDKTSSKTQRSSESADGACTTSSSSKPTTTSSSSATLSTTSQTHAFSQPETPPTYTTKELPPAYDTFTTMSLPSYVDAAAPEYSAVASVQAASVTQLGSSKSSSASTPSSSTPTPSLSSSSLTTTTESMPSYGYNFDAASATAAWVSVASTSKSKPSKATSSEEHPSKAASFLSSDPGHEVENTASSESKSQIPGIETVPPLSKGSATTRLQPAVTTQALPIGGGPPVLFVTIIEPDSNGTLETSVLTVSEKPPWQTPMPNVEDPGDTALRARVDGYRMGMAPNIVTQDSNGPTTTILPVNTGNRTSNLIDAVSNATETSADVPQTFAPTSLPVVSSGSEISHYMINFTMVILSWILVKWIANGIARCCR